MPQGQLAQVLRGLDDRKDARMLVGPQSFDDAGVFVLGPSEGVPLGAPGSPRVALVQTLDFFPPVVDDPYSYGAIAATNSLSDVYAMGGRPLTALTLASLPKGFDPKWTAEIFRGGFDKIAEAGAVVVGGHTVESDIQFGFSVTGVVDPARMTANSGARAGDLVYLTKPVGMGSMTTAAKKRVIDWATMLPAVEQMAMLNARAADAMIAAGSRAATDVTGFGLVGHGRNVAKASGVTLRIEVARVPIFPGALELASAGHCSGGAKRGRIGLAAEVRSASHIGEGLLNVVFDAETSGGLLIAIPPERAEVLERELRARDVMVACIGAFVAPTGVHVELA
ncbi:MAG TPA: selenide, water dikinase SelD [Planctomycetota bacterium]|nr:selenide, water dikinase SelD [Planctomycetota bacterium]